MKSKVFLRAGIVFAALLFGLCLTAQAHARSAATLKSPVSGESAFGAASDELKIFELINRERGKKGLSGLKWDGALARVARDYSEKMARGNFFSHYESNGADVAARADASKIKGWSKIGENLFYCAGVREIEQFAVQNWMKSPAHRRNILDSAYTATGIGLARSREGKIYVTQIFVKN